jgi:hypothetical protein
MRAHSEDQDLKARERGMDAFWGAGIVLVTLGVGWRWGLDIAMVVDGLIFLGTTLCAMVLR